MERRGWWYRGLAAVVTTAILLPSGGCVELFTTAAYLIKGTDADADYSGLKNKKIVVVCRPLASMQIREIGTANALASQISNILKKEVSSKVVDQQKVAAWTDENQWQEFPEVGKALGADMVVGVDLSSFSTYQGPTLYQGKATVSIKVFDLKDDDKVAWQTELPQMLYPHNVGIPISEKTENDFRREFTAFLAERIAREFYSHDRHADIGKDAGAFD